MVNDPLISVIMPVFNSENSLKRSVDSILKQSYKNIELILIDDGSKDFSGDICDSFAEKDQRVIVIHQQNAGVSVARNRGIEEANGKYLTFVDSDDTVDENAYKIVIEHLRSKYTDMVIYGMSFDYYKGNAFIHRKDYSIGRDLTFYIRDINKCFFNMYESNYLSSACNKLFRASLIKSNKIYFNEEMAILEDFKFVLDVLEHSKKVTAVQEVFYRYYNDLTISSLKKRSDIDYIQNFRVLDNKLRQFADFAELNTEEDCGRISAMVLRYYLIGVEKVFASNISCYDKYQELNRYIMDEKVKQAVDTAVCTGKRLKTTQWLMNRQLLMELYVAFWFNNFYRQIKRKLGY